MLLFSFHLFDLSYARTLTSTKSYFWSTFFARRHRSFLVDIVATIVVVVVVDLAFKKDEHACDTMWYVWDKVTFNGISHYGTTHRQVSEAALRCGLDVVAKQGWRRHQVGLEAKQGKTKNEIEWMTIWRMMVMWCVLVPTYLEINVKK